MAVKYRKKRNKQNYLIYTLITVLLLSVVFLTMVSYLYTTTQEVAYENLHIQTKQIKDDITLQLISDRENLATMANFASKLYRDGESYSLMFDSFKPIGLIENIGILNPDNIFVTKAGVIDLNGLISFADEARKGPYISGRIKDLTKEGYEIIRSAVPINANGQTVGILYGVIKLDKIGEKYNKMAQELDAQLFVYEKESKDLVIDTIHKDLGNITFLKDREYNRGYSFEEMMATDKGFVAFKSAYRNENLHMHYSTIEDIGWMIALGRYDSQVFTEAQAMARVLLFVFLIMLCIMAIYILILVLGEKRTNDVTRYASEIRKRLLETVDGQNNIYDALVELCDFAKSRSAVFFDTNGDDYKYISAESKAIALLKNDRHYFKTELFRYATELYKGNKTAVSVMCIKPNMHLLKTNPTFYSFLKEHKIKDISFAAVVNNINHITILGTVNAKRGKSTRMLEEKVAACFSMALYNKNHINKTEKEATTDSLTGVLNRVSYNKDVALFNEEKADDFSCIYIDVNELHIINNKYGHAAGDDMLLYVANALKDVFSGHRIYRIGGDEFVVFAKNTQQSDIKKGLVKLEERVKLQDYHIAVGMSFRSQNVNTNEMIKEAEIRMYEEKALYYQNKEKVKASVVKDKDFVQIKTGILEIDTILSVLKENYNGIYRVTLDTDKARRILMPAYLGYNESEEHFSSLFSRYVSEEVDPDYYRAVISFMNYEVIKRQLMDDIIPKIRYKKNNGESVVLSVYKLCDGNDVVSDTLWVFSKD